VYNFFVYFKFHRILKSETKLILTKLENTR